MTRFEDFTVGDRVRHGRGCTVHEVEGQLLAKLVMNSAQAHFNDDAMAATPFGQRIVFGLITALERFIDLHVGVAEWVRGREHGADRADTQAGVDHARAAREHRKVRLAQAHDFGGGGGRSRDHASADARRAPGPASEASPRQRSGSQVAPDAAAEASSR